MASLGEREGITEFLLRAHSSRPAQRRAAKNNIHTRIPKRVISFTTPATSVQFIGDSVLGTRRIRPNSTSYPPPGWASGILPYGVLGPRPQSPTMETSSLDLDFLSQRGQGRPEREARFRLVSVRRGPQSASARLQQHQRQHPTGSSHWRLDCE